MDNETAPQPARPRLNPYTKALRRERIFSRLQLGASSADIAREEGLSEQRVRKIVADALKRREVDEPRDHALLQLVRLEGAQPSPPGRSPPAISRRSRPTSRFSTASTATGRRPARRGRSTTTTRGRDCSPR
jgi:DNA-binding CsgD family transcriptional regulator